MVDEECNSVYQKKLDILEKSYLVSSDELKEGIQLAISIIKESQYEDDDSYNFVDIDDLPFLVNTYLLEKNINLTDGAIKLKHRLTKAIIDSGLIFVDGMKNFIMMKDLQQEVDYLKHDQQRSH